MYMSKFVVSLLPLLAPLSLALECESQATGEDEKERRTESESCPTIHSFLQFCYVDLLLCYLIKYNI